MKVLKLNIADEEIDNIRRGNLILVTYDRAGGHTGYHVPVAKVVREIETEINKRLDWMDAEIERRFKAMSERMENELGIAVAQAHDSDRPLFVYSDTPLPN